MIAERAVDALGHARTALERLAERLGLADAVDPERALAVARAIPRVAEPVAAHAAQVVRLDDAALDGVGLGGAVLDLDELAAAHGRRQHGQHVLVERRRLRRRGAAHVVAPERGLELRAHVVERGARVGGHERADEVEREQERLRLERREPRGPAELVAVELLLDVDRAPLVDALGIHGVAAAAEVDEVEQLQVILELLVAELEALGQLGRVDEGVLAVAAGGRARRRASPAVPRSAPA